MIASDAWAILQDLSDDDPLYLELLAKLLNTERFDGVVQQAFSIRKGENLNSTACWGQTMSRRTGVYKDLEACFETSALPKAAAIQQAETIREMKQAQGVGSRKSDRSTSAAEEPDTDSIDVAAFQSAWSRLKFGQPPAQTEYD